MTGDARADYLDDLREVFEEAVHDDDLGPVAAVAGLSVFTRRRQREFSEAVGDDADRMMQEMAEMLEDSVE